MVLNDNTVKFQLDSCATVNILPVDIYQKITKDQKLRAQDKPNTNLVMFNKSQLRALGKIRIETRNAENKKTYQVEYVVVSEGFKGLLGAKSIQALNLITVNVDYCHSLYNGRHIKRTPRCIQWRRPICQEATPGAGQLRSCSEAARQKGPSGC